VNFLGGNSALLQETIAPASTQLSLQPVPTDISAGQPVTLTATVTNLSSPSLSPSGVVNFYLDPTDVNPGVLLGSASLTNGTANFSTSALPPGKHLITAIFNVAGIGNFKTSNRSSVVVVVS
jgi:hypothetical protein